jgi:TPR repeat protein
LLGAPDSQVHGLVAFALAETYDPNMLAAWGTRGVAADVAKAKALYGEALERGVARARRRLEALQ